MKTWNFFDKSSWPERGPWDSEPDKAQWIDPETGLDCLMVRGEGLGFWCGYVGVPETHPAFGKPYDEIDVSVHGGLTFGDFCSEGDENGPFVCHVPEPGRPPKIFWFGFDCAHCFDAKPALDKFNGGSKGESEIKNFPNLKNTYRDFQYVKDQCKQLAAQLSKVGIATTLPTSESSL